MAFSPEDIERKHFLAALRGYDREQVDGFLRAVADEYRTMLQELESAREDLARARSEAGELGRVGEHVERILRVATQSAEEIRAASQEEAARLRGEAQRQLDSGRQAMAEATREADGVASEAVKTELRREEAERLWEEATSAEADAARVREDAQRLREDVEQEVSQMRQLRAEAEQLRQDAAGLLADAEREVAERRIAWDAEMARQRAEANRLMEEAEWARQESVRTLEAAEEELVVALELRAEAERRIAADPVAAPAEALPGPRATSGAAAADETTTRGVGR